MIRIMIADPDPAARKALALLIRRKLGTNGIVEADDVGARNHLQRWLSLPEKLNYEAVHRVLKPWQDYGGLVYFHLLLKSLLEKSVIDA